MSLTDSVSYPVRAHCPPRGLLPASSGPFHRRVGGVRRLMLRPDAAPAPIIRAALGATLTRGQ